MNPVGLRQNPWVIMKSHTLAWAKTKHRDYNSSIMFSLPSINKLITDKAIRLVMLIVFMLTIMFWQHSAISFFIATSVYGISRILSSAPTLLHGLNDNVISALVGAVVGSLTGYIFNSSLEKKKSVGRYQVQRKNTIYSPIYKMLTSLLDFLHAKSIGSGGNYNSKVHITDSGETDGYHSFSLETWTSMQKDIRYEYVPNSIKQNMTTLRNGVNELLAIQDRAFREYDEISNTFFDKLQKEYSVSEDIRYGDVATALIKKYLVVYPTINDAEIAQLLKTAVADEKKALLLVKEFDNEVIAHTQIQEWRRIYRSIQEEVNLGIVEVRKVISKVIKEQEGGL